MNKTRYGYQSIKETTGRRTVTRVRAAPSHPQHADCGARIALERGIQCRRSPDSGVWSCDLGGGGWQSWTNITSNVTLANGEQVVEIVLESGNTNTVLYAVTNPAGFYKVSTP